MSAATGLFACAVSSVFFGSMFVPVRRYASGDGLFVQWIMCSSIFAIGICVYLFRGMPQFEPLAMIGGLCWAVGNLTALPIIKCIGMGLGALIWGVVNCCVGWAIGRFGLLGTNASVPDNIIMNYFGLSLVIVGGFMFSQIKTDETAEEPIEDVNGAEDGQLAPSPQHNPPMEAGSEEERAELVAAPAEEEERPDPISNHHYKKLMGILLSMLAGICYGVTFVPVIYIQDNRDKYPHAPKDAVDYVMSHYTGIYLTSTAVFLTYVVFKQNKPFVNAEIIGPAFGTGLLWSFAQMAWFIANDCLSQVITFPINSMVPGVVATLWSVFYFNEIKGRRNFQILGVAIVVTLTGAALVGLSK